MQLFTALCLLLPLSIYAQQAAQIRVIEEEAIPFTRFLSKADFDQRYPGKLLSDAAKLDTGWYVIYQHESLNYYFGPMLLESTGQDYFEQFKETVGEAVDQRPSIEGYRLELSFEPQIATTNPSGSTPPQSGEPQIGSGTPQPAPKPSIFDFIKRIFGFG
ncbi:MAG TPA: hypothetical protein DCX06_06440 [Opitutae bacterium]|nr:hypothetical protein [Opitutae bacterium]